MTADRRWRWSGADVFSTVASGGRVAVVDSWLVEDGRSVSLDAHADRFVTACAALFSVPRGRARAFVRAAVRRIPATGRWFPRLELTDLDGEPVFQLWLRPAPARGATVRLWVYDGVDARRCPTVKGPDLDWLAQVRSAAQERGADEALLLDGDGRLIEGTTTSLLWWHGDTLYAPDTTRLDLLPSVTRATLLRIAATSGTPVAYACPRPSDLSGLETWAVNALHGIRPVRQWTGAPTAAGRARRAPIWQARLDALASATCREHGLAKERGLL
ncbi:aminotransferase class IV [Streptomyces sp. 351MFTsu5.1]|uniref:aminotransferase class IV n=1 Tax=Streptomyces sp. 351MFTsu5.1 TaxID=1172180 RepID=UPI00037F5ACF|nr:aminotransferase class IV [Streptomyces sp. 351MFTsu5.1]